MCDGDDADSLEPSADNDAEAKPSKQLTPTSVPVSAIIVFEAWYLKREGV
jgi:hypothetical protein